MMCVACRRGDHANCNLANWCDCDSGLDGDPDAIPEDELIEEDGPMDLEDQLDHALDLAFPGTKRVTACNRM